MEEDGVRDVVIGYVWIGLYDVIIIIIVFFVFFGYSW